MSKEQTPIEKDLIELIEVFDGKGIPNNTWVKNKLEEILIKQNYLHKEQLKDAIIEFHVDYEMFRRKHISEVLGLTYHYDRDDVRKQAEQYFKEQYGY